MEDSQKTKVAPQQTAVAPQKTAVSPSSTVVNPAQQPLPPPSPNRISGGKEAEIQIVNRDGKQYAQKLYYKGYHPNTAVIEKLKPLNGKGFIADTIETGVAPDGREYEIQEYFPKGALNRYDLRKQGAIIQSIVVKIAMALREIHLRDVIHKDVKPANILVKNTKTWDCVLCDFGIADILTDGKSLTRQSRTPIYAAPELYDPKRAKARVDGEDLFEITAEADYYSLGMTALCLWYGEDFFKKDEEKLILKKLGDGISVPTDMPDKLRRIVSGLLEKDPSKRWDINDIAKCIGGQWAMEFSLNPAYDARMMSDPKDPEYAVAGATIGAFFNKLYFWRYLNDPLPAKSDVCSAAVNSCFKYQGSYMQQFFAIRGDRYKEQDRWMKSCADWKAPQNTARPGANDSTVREQIIMMRIIKGFGFTPEYKFEDGTVVTTIEELDKVDPDLKKNALKKGLVGWLAVQYHENPWTDFSEKYTYESLLDKFVRKIEEFAPEHGWPSTYNYAQNQVLQKYYDNKAEVTKLNIRDVLQTVAGSLFAIAPLVFCIVWIILSLCNKPLLSIGDVKFEGVFFILAVVAAVFAYFDAADEGCLLSIIIGAVTALVVWLAVKFLSKILVWLLLAVVITALVLFIIKVTADNFWGKKRPSKLKEPDFEHLVLEPLCYTFNYSKSWSSSYDNCCYDTHKWNYHLKEKRRKTLIGIGIALALTVATCFIPKPAFASASDEQEQIEQIETTDTNENLQQVQ